MSTKSIHRSAWIGLAVALLFSSTTSASTIEGSARITDGVNNLFDASFSDKTDPVQISEFAAIPGINTLLGLVNVNGTGDGTFHVDSFGQETFEHESLFLFSDTFENTSATSQAFTMDFNINAGMLQNRVFESPLNPPGTSGEFLESGYEAIIRVNGVESFFSRAVVRNTGTFGNLTKTGVDLMGTFSNTGSAPSNSTYAWSNFLGMLDLGVLAPGQTVSIDYEMRTFVSGMFESCGSRGCGSGFASIGDPVNVSSIGAPGSITGSPVGPSVPAPATLLLLAPGVLVLARRSSQTGR